MIKLSNIPVRIVVEGILMIPLPYRMNLENTTILSRVRWQLIHSIIPLFPAVTNVKILCQGKRLPH